LFAGCFRNDKPTLTPLLVIVIAKPGYNPQPLKRRCIVHLGKDFWFFLKLFRIIVDVLSRLGKEENEDTPDGQE